MKRKREAKLMKLDYIFRALHAPLPFLSKSVSFQLIPFPSFKINKGNKFNLFLLFYNPPAKS